MSTITTRAGKGSPLTNTELDANFTNLNTDKLELGGTYSGGTANGVVYLNGSKVATTGSALTFDGQILLVNAAQGTLTVGNGTAGYPSVININGGTTGANGPVLLGLGAGSNEWLISSLRSITGGGAKGLADYIYGDFPRVFYINGSEQMRLTSTGLGIGTSSPTYKLNIESGALGNTSGDSLSALQLGCTSLNSDKLNFKKIRDSNGAGWETAGWRIQQRIDSTDMGYIQFNGTGLTYGISFGTGNTERMRIDSSGNLGLGVTPSAWASNTKSLDMANNGTFSTSVGAYFATQIGNNFYDNSGYKYKATGHAATMLQTYNGAWYFNTAPSGTAGNSISFTQAMTLDASGRLGIGQTSPAALLHLKGSSPAILVEDTGANRAVLGIIASNTEVTFDATAHTSAVQAMVFKTGNSERMRINSSGNVGIGTSSPSWPLNIVSGTTVGNNDLLAIAPNDGALGRESRMLFGATFSNGWGGSDFSVRYSGGIGYGSTGGADPRDLALKFYTTNKSSGIDTPTERMRIDSSGNVGIGTSSPGGDATNRVVQAYATGSAAFQASTASVGVQYGVSSGGYGSINVYTNHPLTFATNNTERMRMDSSGNLLVGKTTNAETTNGWSFSANGAGNCKIGSGYFVWNRDTDDIIINFRRSNASVGTITVNTTSTTYNTSSDYRLKENIQPMQNALDVVAQLNPVRYTWKADGSDGQGFIAHELQAVVPDCVTGEKDAVDDEGKPVYQGVDTSFLVATLTKAIQEQQELINQLTARVAQLEGN